MISFKQLFLLMIFCIAPTIYAYKHELAVCAIFQNESRFLKEWLEFYKLVGVEHFYLYDNNSTDNYKEILYPYIKAGQVSLMRWPCTNKDLNAQITAFNHCLNKVRGKAKWVAFLDLDEFLFAVKQNSLREFLRDYEEYGAVCANWVMFGTSDVDIIPKNKLMVEVLTMRATITPHLRKHVKSIVQPEKVIAVDSHGATQFKADFFAVTADKRRHSGHLCLPLTTEILRVNHYWTRDKKWVEDIKIPRAEDLKINLMLGDDESWYITAAKAHSITPTEYVLAVADFMNAEQDLTIQRFVLPLRKAMGLDGVE
ncbi:MAG: glycosyltransferase family 92 protein [Candidatus Dependentiae bacterium]|nr:glycosyltransferase family 92 protein [Candidatus Dependentiae bacterium]